MLLHHYKTDSVLGPICHECCYQGWAKRLDSILHFVSYHILCGNTHIVHLPVLEPRHFVPQQLPKPEESRCNCCRIANLLNEGHERRHNGPVDEGGEVPGGLADVGLRLDPVLSDPEAT